tara:strand:- start:59 stop:643 length:585 start_codon:yes stop_codon:yes gene_type:complete
MSFKWGKPHKNKQNRTDPRYHLNEEETEFGSNQENIEKLEKFNLRKALENSDSMFEGFGEDESKVIKEGRRYKRDDIDEIQSRTSYSDEETEAGVDDGRDDSFAETLSNAIMDGWEDTLTAVIKEHLPDEEAKFLDDRGVWVDLGSYDEEMLELAMKIRDGLLDTFDREEDSDYEFSQGFEEGNNSHNRAELDE